MKRNELEKSLQRQKLSTYRETPCKVTKTHIKQKRYILEGCQKKGKRRMKNPCLICRRRIYEVWCEIG